MHINSVPMTGGLHSKVYKSLAANLFEALLLSAAVCLVPVSFCFLLVACFTSPDFSTKALRFPVEQDNSSYTSNSDNSDHIH